MAEKQLELGKRHYYWEGRRWLRHTFPLVCKAFSEVYRTPGASPLHEFLKIDFQAEIDVARAMSGQPADHQPPFQGSRVVAWAQRCASSVHRLFYYGSYGKGSIIDFEPEDLVALVTAVGPYLTDIFVEEDSEELLGPPFWEALRDSAVLAGKLRSLVVIRSPGFVFSETDIEPLGQLEGSLEELKLNFYLDHDFETSGFAHKPESLFALTNLRYLKLSGNQEIREIPAGISALTNLKELDVSYPPLLLAASSRCPRSWERSRG